MRLTNQPINPKQKADQIQKLSQNGKQKLIVVYQEDPMSSLNTSPPTKRFKQQPTTE